MGPTNRRVGVWWGSRKNLLLRGPHLQVRAAALAGSRKNVFFADPTIQVHGRIGGGPRKEALLPGSHQSRHLGGGRPAASLSTPNKSADFAVESRPLADSRSRLRGMETAPHTRFLEAGSVSAGCPLEGDGGVCYLDGSRSRLALFCTRCVVSLLEGVFLGCC